MIYFISRYAEKVLALGLDPLAPAAIPIHPHHFISIGRRLPQRAIVSDTVDALRGVAIEDTVSE